MRIEKLLTAMMEYDHGDVPRIQHFVKVYEFARMIGLMEGLDAKTQFTLESAAVVHDIGIHISEQKYGRKISGAGRPGGGEKAAGWIRMAGRCDRAGLLSGGPSPYLSRYGRHGLSDSGGSGFSGQPF